MTRPLAIDLFCGLGGWAEGFLAAGFDVAGFDNGHTAPYASGARYPGQLVIQDVLTLHGSQFRDAAVIVASPPCQNYSYLAMPWSRSKSEHSQKAKAMRRKWETEGPDNRLFDACFRIQLEAIEATRKPCVCWSGKQYCNVCEGTGSFTRYIPLIVENVRGAQPWVGRSAWNYGSFHLWGDVPALMPITLRRGQKGTKPVEHRGWTQGCAITLGLESYNGVKANPDGTNHPPGSWFRIADSSQGDRGDGIKKLYPRGDNQTCGQHRMGLGDGQKVPVYSDPRRNGGKGSHLTSPGENAAKLEDGTNSRAAEILGSIQADGGKGFDGGLVRGNHHGAGSRFNSKSNARKMASAMIAKIPRELAEHIARVYYPRPN